jgi:hypothetical protein
MALKYFQELPMYLKNSKKQMATEFFKNSNQKSSYFFQQAMPQWKLLVLVNGK